MDNIAIIILNYKNYHLTIECVNNLLKLKINKNIVIVDNNSPNESIQNLEKSFRNQKNIVIIQNKENKGYASGNNIGIKYAIKNLRCDYVCIMNPDIIVDNKEIFNDLSLQLENTPLDGITAIPITNNIFDYTTIGWKIPSFKDLVISNSMILSYIYNPIQYKKLNVSCTNPSYAELEVMPGCFFILKSEFIEKVGYFDENTFLYYEENILAIKAKNNNSKFGVSLNHYYFHNHLSKDIHLDNFNNKLKDRKIILKSQKYYAIKYLKIKNLNRLLLNLSQFFNLYIEMPVLHVIKQIITN